MPSYDEALTVFSEARSLLARAEDAMQHAVQAEQQKSAELRQVPGSCWKKKFVGKIFGIVVKYKGKVGEWEWYRFCWVGCNVFFLFFTRILGSWSGFFVLFLRYGVTAFVDGWNLTSTSCGWYFTFFSSQLLSRMDSRHQQLYWFTNFFSSWKLPGGFPNATAV